MESYYIKKALKKKGETITRYQIINPNEYKELEKEISTALQECIDKITASGGSPRSTVPDRSTNKMEQTTT